MLQKFPCLYNSHTDSLSAPLALCNARRTVSGSCCAAGHSKRRIRCADLCLCGSCGKLACVCDEYFWNDEQVASSPNLRDGLGRRLASAGQLAHARGWRRSPLFSLTRDTLAGSSARSWSGEGIQVTQVALLAYFSDLHIIIMTAEGYRLAAIERPETCFSLSCRKGGTITQQENQ
jgi:hypothetical protein